MPDNNPNKQKNLIHEIELLFYRQRIRLEVSAGVGIAGFWIGLGIVVAAAVLKGQVVIK
jgi:hypothetical protein